MMRMLLGSAGLLFMWVFCAPTNGQAKAEPPAPRVFLPRQEFGAGDTHEKAREQAFVNAEKKVNELIHEHGLKHFKVDRDYLVRNLLADAKGKAGEDIALPQAGQAPLKQWVLTYKTDRDWWSELVRLDRAEARQALASRLMIGLAALLGVGFGYVRLDQYTNRRYTPWLRAAGAAVAATVAAGWWYVANVAA